jgi:cellulose synthase/poly-beta-1,6-N-acetylglucosamine synthase-like glycosyltransferase
MDSTDTTVETTLSASIIICARNEEKNIGNLLDALMAQDYPMSQIEVIVADDQSTDVTATILCEYSRRYPQIRHFCVEGREQSVSPKKNALTQAIDLATHEIILLTDADCLPTKHWVSSHLNVYSSEPLVDMVVGFSQTNCPDDPSVVQKFEYIDFMILMFAAQGAVQSGKPFSCSGQNLSYKKESFTKAGGFVGIENNISGDDLLLMQRFVSSGMIVSFANERDAYTTTQPANSWRDLCNQRARWASNLKAMRSINHRFYIYLLSCFVCMSLLPMFFVLSLLLFTFSGGIHTTAIVALTAMLVIKYATEYSFVQFAMNLYQRTEKDIKYYPLWLLICPIYTIVVTTKGIFSAFQWKDRRGTI